MTVRFFCDAPGCAGRRGESDFDYEDSDRSRYTSERSDIRAERHPSGAMKRADPIAMKDGRRLYACSKACATEIRGSEGCDGMGKRIGATCPACGLLLNQYPGAGDSWGDFLHHRARAIRWIRDNMESGKTIEEECCCLAELDADGVVSCIECGEEMIAIDFATGDEASEEQIEMLMLELCERRREAMG